MRKKLKNKIITSIIILCVIFCSFVYAETWPTLKEYVKRCVLIVKCEIEITENTIKYRVVETWKGKYSSDLFYNKPEEGYLYTNNWHGNENPEKGQEIIFFFTADNHPYWTKGKILSHSTAFPVKDDKIIYASTNEWMWKEYKVEDFKNEILSIDEKKTEK